MGSGRSMLQEEISAIAVTTQRVAKVLGTEEQKVQARQPRN